MDIKVCQVPDCGRDAVRGDNWLSGREPLRAFRLGLELSIEVKDMAVVLALCEAHADELMTLAWTPVQERLDSWGWQPMPPGRL